MIFSELYGVYYNTVARILEAAIRRPLAPDELRRMIEKYAFAESVLHMEPALLEEKWQILKSDGTTPLQNAPAMPLTLLQKRWLKAISMDPRIRLFTDHVLEYPDVEPLFTPEDVSVFDAYADGDDYENEAYRQNFRRILDALQKKYPLRLVINNQKDAPMQMAILPEYLEYSEKDDKFRLIGAGNRKRETVNLGRIVSCEPLEKPCHFHPEKRKDSQRTVTFELVDRRKALERVLMHFAHFEKEAEKLTDYRYRISVTYDEDDELEMVIRILSFGPMIQVTAPAHFVNLIKEKLMCQKSCKLS